MIEIEHAQTHGAHSIPCYDNRVIMKRRSITALAFLLFAILPTSTALAVDEADRLFLVGERATADGIAPVARRALERFVQEFPQDPRLPQAVLLLGRARLAVGDYEAGLEAFKRAQTMEPPPGRPLEAKFWEGEALFRLRRFADARAAYDAVLKGDASSPLAADAQYGLAWTDLELKRPEAAKAFRDFLDAWPNHPLAPSATFYLARALVEQRRFNEALPLLQGFLAKSPNHKLAPDARYLLGVARVNGGDPRAGVADLRAFIEAAPQHPDAALARRTINETLGRYGDRQELQDTYTALMAQSPTTAEALNDAASIAGRLARPKDQEAALKKLRTEFPDHPLAYRAALDLANAAFKRKEFKDASAQAQVATKSEEDGVRAEAFLLSGESELKLKRFPTAAKAFEAAADVKTADAAVRYRALAGLGLAREEQREWRSALVAYESVAAKSPDPTLRDWAKERVAAVKQRLSNGGSAAKPKSGS